MERPIRPISHPKPKLSSPGRVRYSCSTPIDASCSTNDNGKSQKKDLGIAGREGLTIAR
jgi:hypothetical protein